MKPLPALPNPAASGSGSASSGNASNPAAAAAGAASPDDAKKAELALTPGLEQLTQAQIDAAFMGETVEIEGAKQKKAANKKPDADGDDADGDDADGDDADGDDADGDDADGDDADGDDADGDDADGDDADGDDADGDDADGNESDLERGLKKAKLSPALRKRLNQLLKQNPALKREVATLRQQVEAKRAEPEVVTAPTTSNLFAAARNAAEVEQLAVNLLNDAEDKLDWLDNHRDGGTYGTDDKAVQLTAEQVAEYRKYYRQVSRSVDGQKAARLDWLKRYAETMKGIPADQANELVKPAVETRESRFAKHVMAEPDYLQFLADAKAGREHREKLGKGIKFVEVKPGAKAPVKKPDGEKPKADGSKTGSPAKPAPKSKEQAREKQASTLTQAALDKLRADAEAGDKRAQEQLERLFMGA